MDYLFAQVRNLLTEKFGVPAELVTEDATFEQLDLDSLDLVEFAMATQDTFGARISDEEAESLRTVGEAVTLLSGKLAAAEA